MTQRGHVNILAIVGIVIVVGVIGYFVVGRQASPLPLTPSTTPTPTPISTQTPTPTPAEQSSNLLTTPLAGGTLIINGYKYEFAYKQGPVGNVLNDHLVFVSASGDKTVVPDNVWFQIYAGSAFEKTGKRDGQNLTSFDMPVHPVDNDVIFLSTSESLNEGYSRIKNRIYSYNLKTSELKEIYSEVAENNSPMGSHSARIFRTVGIDGSKVIVLYDDPDNSPGPCTRIWYHYKDRMGYLELADVQGGLKTYSVPVYKVEEDRVDADQCLNES